MHGTDIPGSLQASRWRTYFWGALAVVSCPCHLPLLIVVFAGTTAGAFISDNLAVAALMLIGLFALSVTRVLRGHNR